MQAKSNYNKYNINPGMSNLNPLTIILILSIYGPVSAQFNQLHKRFWQRTSLSQSLSNCTYFNGPFTNQTLIQLGNCFNDLYYISLGIGTDSSSGSSNQVFNFQFDTGSPILWIPVGQNSSTFNPNQSSTYEITNTSITLTYADNSSVSGNMGSDIVTVSSTPISANNSILFVIDDQTNFGNIPVDGLVGMDYPSTPNFLDQAFAVGKISTPMFSLDLNSPTQPSFMYYNNGLSQEIMSQTYWIEMFGTDHWQVEVIGFFVGGVEMTSSASDIAVVDSGTSLLVLNPDIYNAIMQQYFSFPECNVDFEGLTECFCNRTWPTLAFMFKGAQVQVPGSGYQNSQDNGFCQVELQTLTTVSQIILGDVFFRQYIISFDRMNTQVGFYGQITPVHQFDPEYFNIIQYVMCGLSVVLAFAGVTLSLIGRAEMENKVERKLGMQLMSY